MGWPRFCIINGNRAVKAAETEEGGLAVLEYIPEHNEYRLAMALLLRFSCGDIDTDIVSEEEFEAFVSKQRAEAQQRRDNPLPEKAD